MLNTKIYVGSDNKTGELEMVKILDVMNRWQDNFTIIEAIGYYKGKRERVAIIEIYGSYNLGIIPELKRELNQESILVVESINEVKFYD